MFDSVYQVPERPIAALPCRLEQMAASSGRVSAERTKILAMLLDATRITTCGERQVLRPLWDDEAMRRACSMLQLVALLEDKSHLNASNPTTLMLETAVAADLAMLYRALDFARDEEELPCSEILEGVVTDLVTLFAPAVGDVLIKTNIERLTLPAYKRRSLVMLGSELVINALHHAFKHLIQGQIVVTLRVIDSSEALFMVADDGQGLPPREFDQTHGVASCLADLLEGDLLYARCEVVGTTAVVAFPITSPAVC